MTTTPQVDDSRKTRREGQALYFSRYELRWMLYGVPLHCGDGMDMLIDGKWVEGRFEVSHDGPDATHRTTPLFFWRDEDGKSRGREIPEHAVVRFPVEAAGWERS